ncbi:MAG: galactosylceramidase [Streptosporangiales bacterium]|nr:galactosylceramidase [Streptosporangiales bacterium]
MAERQGRHAGGARRRLTVALTVALGLLAALLLPVTERSADAAPVQAVTLDGDDTGLRFDGVGGVSAGGFTRLLLDYPPRERAEILDYLFRPDYGAALDLLKVEIGADIDSTVGSEPTHMRARDEVRCDRGYEWWLMREAQKRNPDIEFYALGWGAPGWFEGGYWSQDRVEYLIGWLDCAKRNGFDIAYLGAGNESGYDRDVYVELAAALDEHGYSDVKVVGTDNHHPPDYWNATTEMVGDPEFADAVDVLGEHDVCVWRTLQQKCHVSDDAASLGKPLWDSENSTQDFDVGPGPLARAMNRHYTDGKITGNLNWALLSAWYDHFPIGGTGLMLAERPWSGFYEVGPSIWVDAHTTQFTDPGWRYLDHGSGYTDAGASYVSLRSPDSGDYSTVVETLDSTGPETLRFDVDGLSRSPVRVWSTNLETRSTHDDFLPAGAIRPDDGTYSLTVEPGHVYTVSTTRGQSKGGAHPHADPGEQLRVPYTEDFERVGPLKLARYWSDVHGGFEAVPCAGGRRGTCYEQTVTTQPLPWHGVDLLPMTFAGDPRWWGDYEVSAAVMLDEKGYVELLGRVDSQQHSALGYHLRVADTGEWTLYSQELQTANRVLASGTTAALGTDRWHRLAMRFEGDRITVSLDGERLGEVRDDHHTTGQVGFTVGDWQRAQFDDVRVTPTAPAPRFVPHSRMSVTATSEHAANDFGHAYTKDLAADDRLWSLWRSEYTPLAALPQSLTLDLGRRTAVRGVAYTPSVTTRDGTITSYRMHVSDDGETFRPVASGRWEPTGGVRTASFDPTAARYVRLEALEAHGVPGSVSVAELGVATTRIPSLGAP